jgi:hypothetical protein
MVHYTNQEGYNGIQSQPDWIFRANQPRAKHNPVGAYFTTYLPDEPHLAVKLFVPRRKLEYMFQFQDIGDLELILGGRGRNKRIFYSPEDYIVTKESERQIYKGETGL